MRLMKNCVLQTFLWSINRQPVSGDTLRGATPGDKREIGGITQNYVAWSLNVETLESLNKHFCLYLHSQWGKYPLKPAWVHKAYIVGWMNIFCLINLLPSFCNDLAEGCDVQYFLLRFLVFMQFSTFSPQVHLFPNFPDTFTEQWVYFAKLNHPYFFTLSQTQQSWESRDSRKWGQKSQLITHNIYSNLVKSRAIVCWIVHYSERYLRVCMSQVPYPRNVLEKKNALSLVRDQDITERISDWRATKLVGGGSKDAVPSAIWSLCFPFCVKRIGEKYMRHWTSAIWSLCFLLSVE